MSFCLPKPGLTILPVSLIGTDVHLIEWSVDGYTCNLTSCFPVCFLSSMEILSDGFRTRVPEPHPLGHVVAEGVIGEGEGDIEEGK